MSKKFILKRTKFGTTKLLIEKKIPLPSPGQFKTTYVKPNKDQFEEIYKDILEAFENSIEIKKMRRNNPEYFI